jgi:hypothetical protein
LLAGASRRRFGDIFETDRIERAKLLRFLGIPQL